MLFEVGLNVISTYLVTACLKLLDVVWSWFEVSLKLAWMSSAHIWWPVVWSCLKLLETSLRLAYQHIFCYRLLKVVLGLLLKMRMYLEGILKPTLMKLIKGFWKSELKTIRGHKTAYIWTKFEPRSKKSKRKNRGAALMKLVLLFIGVDLRPIHSTPRSVHRAHCVQQVNIYIYRTPWWLTLIAPTPYMHTWAFHCQYFFQHWSGG